MLLGHDFKCEMVSWDDLYEYSRVLAYKVREDKFKPDAVIALARGGYTLARYLKDFLSVDKLYTLQVEHLWSAGKASVDYPLHADVKGKNVLLVDDLVDTGASFKAAKEYVQCLKPKALKTACVFAVDKSPFRPDYCAARKEWKWFVFPWNYDEDVAHLVAGLFDRKEKDKKSLDMVAEELRARHGINLPKAQLRPVMNALCKRRLLKPYLARGGLLRWMPA